MKNNIGTEISFLENSYKYIYLQGKDALDFSFKEAGGLFFLDIETYAKGRYRNDLIAGLIPAFSKIRTIQLLEKGSDTVYILDLSHPNNNAYLMLDKDFVSRLHKFLLNNHIVAHNAQFDMSHLQNIFYTYFERSECPSLDFFCTMQMWNLFMHATSTEEKPKATLQHIIYALTGEYLEKETQRSDFSFPVELEPYRLKYCARDVVALSVIFPILLQAIKELGLKEILELNLKAQGALVDMRLSGIAIDKEKHLELMQEWEEHKNKKYIECLEALNKEQSGIGEEEKRKTLLFKITNEDHIAFLESNFNLLSQGFSGEGYAEDRLTCEGLIDSDIDAKLKTSIRKYEKNLKKLYNDPNSTKDKSAWLEESLDDAQLASWGVNEKSGQLKVDKGTFKDASFLPEAKILNEYSYYSKLVNAFGKGLLKFIRERGGVNYIYPNFSLTFTKTGRMSSMSPNLQQISRGESLRSIFIPREEGRRIICADYSQIELRVAAELSGDKVMQKAYREGADLHMITACGITGKQAKDVTKEERSIAKTISFSVLYGGGIATIIKNAKNLNVELSDDEARRLLFNFKDTYKELTLWQRGAALDAEELLVTKTPTGKVCVLAEDNYYTKSLNYPIQGGAGEVMLNALVYLSEWLKDRDFDSYLVNCVHDEVVVDAAECEIEEVASGVEECMVRGFLKVFPNGVTQGLVNINIGNNWEEAK